MLRLSVVLFLLVKGASLAASQPDPEAHFKRVMANGHLKVAGRITGEQFCWHAAHAVAFVVEAYHTGVVFTEGDLEGIISTNLDNMWNGDADAPRWRNAGIGAPWKEPRGKSAGTLWAALADFDGRARTLQAGRLVPGSIAHGYFHNRTLWI